MSVVYSNALKDTRMTSVITAVDAGGAAGTMEICTAAYAAVLGTIPLQRPSFTEASQTITVSGVPLSATAAASGTAALARVKDSGGNIVVSGLTVGTSGADMIITPSATVSSGQQLTLASGTITHG
jgi:hypothetical protein